MEGAAQMNDTNDSDQVARCDNTSHEAASLQEHEHDVQKAWAAEIERRSLEASGEHGTDWRAALEEIRAEVLRR
jgi:hypothetical protein